jgi:G3E family GTPase
VKGEERRLVFQAVHMILEGDFQRPWTDKDNRYSRMVFIGRDLDEAELKAGSRRRRLRIHRPLSPAGEGPPDGGRVRD